MLKEIAKHAQSELQSRAIPGQVTAYSCGPYGENPYGENPCCSCRLTRVPGLP